MLPAWERKLIQVKANDTLFANFVGDENPVFWYVKAKIYELGFFFDSVTSFHLFKRAFHVYSEANRVHLFKAVCDSQLDSAIQELGALMHDSHISCKEMYECSGPELDNLVSLAM